EKSLLKNFTETIDYTCGTTFYGISDLTKANENRFADESSTEQQDDTNDLSLEALFKRCNDAEIFLPTPAGQ
ncbi:13140_t:CDS:2, partial [Gigaspora rosea]